MYTIYLFNYTFPKNGINCAFLFIKVEEISEIQYTLENGSLKIIAVTRVLFSLRTAALISERLN